MKEIRVNASRVYSIYVCSDFNLLKTLIELYKIHSAFIITDKNIYNLYHQYFEDYKDIIVGKSIVEPGEKSKNLETVKNIYETMLEKDINKKTAIVAFGGGVVGDIAGFVSSTFMRGLDLIQIPTTVMAQCDSSIGGKNGLDFVNLKNIIGTFYQPKFVFSNVNFLKTLDDKQYFNGLAEVIKYGVVCDNSLFDYIIQNKKAILEKENDKLLHLIYQTSKIKAAIIEKDELDLGERHVLNFGHTVGHAIESYFNFEILHGEAIAIGMKVESYIALKLGYISDTEYERIISIIKYFKLPTEIKIDNIEQLYSYMAKDKKKTTNHIKLALPKGIGHAIITLDLKENFIKNSLKYCLGG